MLHIFRSKKFARRTLISLLILIIPAFVLWGAGSILRKPNLIGTIGKQKIYPDNFVRSLRGAKIELLLSYYADFEMFKQLTQNRSLINRLAWERLIFLNAAKDKKTRITNKDVLFFLARHPLFQHNGIFDQPAYHRIINNVLYMEPRRFEELVRENLRIRSFHNALFEKIDISEETLMRSYRDTNDQIDVSYVLIDKDSFAGISEPDAEEVKSYYDAHTEAFHAPPEVDIEFIELSYKNADEKDRAVKKLNEVNPKLKKNPTKFKEISEKYGLNYRKPGPLNRDELIPGVKFSKEMHDIAFHLDKGAISPPLFRGNEEGAVYILRKIQDIPPHILPFEEIKDKILEKLSNERRMRLAAETAAGLYEKIIRENIPLEKAADTDNREIRTAKAISLNGYIENIGPAGIIVEKALKTGAGNFLRPVNIPKGVLIVRIDNVIPADEEKFEEMKDALYRDLMTARRKEVLTRWFREQAPRSELRKPLDTL